MESDDEMQLGDMALSIKEDEESAMALALPPGAGELEPRAASQLRVALARAEVLFGIAAEEESDGPLAGGDVKRITMLAKAAEDAIEDDVPGVEALPQSIGLRAETWAALITTWVESLAKSKGFKRWLESEDDMPMAKPAMPTKKAPPKEESDLDFFASRMK
jgi:hypothetical protein